MRRTWAYMPLVMVAALAAPRQANAQIAVRAQLVWTWSDGAWRSHHYDWDDRAGSYYAGSGIWVSAGYLPPPGYCREWIPGVPPAWQPAPVPCDELFEPYGYAHAGIVILGSPGYRGPAVRIRLSNRERYDRDRRFRERIVRDRAKRERDAWAHRERVDVVREPVYKERPNRTSRTPSRSYERSNTKHGGHGSSAERRGDQGRGRNGGRGVPNGNRGKAHHNG